MIEPHRGQDGYRLVVRTGWYLEDSQSDRPAYECTTNYKSACRGGLERYGEASCAPGHTGLLCGECKAPGWYRGRRECLSCDALLANATPTADPVVLILVLSLVTPLLLYVYLYPPHSRVVQAWVDRAFASSGFDVGKVSRRLPRYVAILGGCAKIGLGYCQCLSAIERFPLVVWPDLFYRFIAIVDEVNIELFSTVPMECLANRRMGIYMELLATLSLPTGCCIITLVLITLVTSASRYRRARRAQKRRTWAAERPPATREAALEPDSTARVRTLRAEVWHKFKQPKVAKLMTWIMLFCYPSLARKSLAIFDCVAAGEAADGTAISLLRADPAERCYEGAWPVGASLAGVFGVLLHVVGFPLACFLLAWDYRRHIEVYAEDRVAYERISVIVSTYEERYVTAGLEPRTSLPACR